MKIQVKEMCCIEGCHHEACPGCGGMCIGHGYEDEMDSLWESYSENYDYRPRNPYHVYVKVGKYGIPR